MIWNGIYYIFFLVSERDTASYRAVLNFCKFILLNYYTSGELFIIYARRNQETEIYNIFKTKR